MASNRLLVALCVPCWELSRCAARREKTESLLYEAKKGQRVAAVGLDLGISLRFIKSPADMLQLRVCTGGKVAKQRTKG